MNNIRILLFFIFITRGLAIAQVQDFFVITEKKVNFPINRVAKWGFEQKYLFNQTVVFQNQIFDSILYCRDFRFIKPVNLSGSTFKDTSYFLDNIFEQEVNFSGAQFQDATTFEENVFQQTADFSHTNFSKSVLWYDVQLKRLANFSKAKFNQAYFAGIVFNEKADFTGAIFLNKMHLERVMFKKKVSFRNAKLPREIYIIDLDLSTSFLDFTQAKIPAIPCKLYLEDSKYLHKIKFDYQYFLLNLEKIKYIKTSTTEKLYVDLLEHQKKWGFAKGYQKLLKEYEAFKKDMLITTDVDSHKRHYPDTPLSANEEKTGKETSKMSHRAKDALATKMFAVAVGIVLILAFLHLRLQNKKRKTETIDPIAQVEDKPTFQPSKSHLPLAKIEKCIRISSDLWGDYLLMAHQEIKDDDAFWDQYERLLKKVKC
ncbi:hypothetical protein BKI52_08645 [marine bacterium AO1-C]|nr:hypothetical protein BKI52_08645 [marine bacterium AO1-C]